MRTPHGHLTNRTGKKGAILGGGAVQIAGLLEIERGDIMLFER